MRFATRVLVLQLATVLLVVVAGAAAFTVFGVERLRREAESTALAIARSVAADETVREGVARFSADQGTPDRAAIEASPIPDAAEEVRERTGALFVVVTDAGGIRLSHPDDARLGERVSTDFDDALAGRETVSWEAGTLGDSARAKVPVYAPGGDEPVGEVSVGFARSSVFTALPELLWGVGATAVAALLLGTVTALLIRRHLARVTLGLQPEEIRELVHEQAAVLDGVGEGVLAITPDGVVTVCNDRAARLLGVADAVGRVLGGLGLPLSVRDGLSGEAAVPPGGVIIGGRVVYIERHAVRRDGADVGTVAVLRDRTDIVTLTQRLDAVATMTNALRAQRHEFANRLHVITGLIDAERVGEARDYLAEVTARGPLRFPVEHADRLQERYLQAFLGAKGVEASERGVLLTIGEETLVSGRVSAAEDVATVLGNLVDNAVRAAVEGDGPHWVEVELLDEDDTLHMTVADSGRGVEDPRALFVRDDPAAEAGRAERDRIHGHGFGLPLCRDIARRRGGELWLVDAGGGSGHGAVLCARLPGVMAGAAAPEEER